MPGKRVKDEQQNLIGEELKKRYNAGASIRVLVEESGRSYGYVHTRLAAAGVVFRSRGGNTAASRRRPESGPTPL
ncbi:helix-turn-helix domain-containing protein [Streptomyces sp. NPDC046821]|uniref:helix-turn-helix domain-containing protein n=1 Tax=Streptomyces sp. NPDC046821 TaxID=3154702 RepID=UPI0033F980F3